MPEQALFDMSKATPIAGGKPLFDMSKARPVESKPSQKSTSSKPPEKPGYLKRLGQSFGVPTSMEELKQALPSNRYEAAAAIANPVVYQTAKSSAGYLKELPNAARNAGREVKEAYQNVKEGGPVLQNVGKAASGAVEFLPALPVVGDTAKTAGEDWFHKNYAGALGGMTGLVLQLTGLQEEPRTKLGKVGEASPKGAVERLHMESFDRALNTSLPPYPIWFAAPLGVR